MCLQFDKNRQRDSISNPRFFPNYTSAKKYAIKNASILENWRPSLLPEFKERTFVFYYKIFELPFDQDVVIDDSDPDYPHWEMYRNHVDTIYDPKTTAAMLIQKYWRIIYYKRFVAAVVIKRHLKFAIANPYTELCKRRLMREFHELSSDF